MKGKRKFLCQLLLSTGIIKAAGPARKLVRGSSNGELVILNYHRIFAERAGARNGGTARPRFDEGVFSIDQETFRSQMRWLRANSDLLSEADLLDFVRNARKLPPRPTLVTFDDGYRDCYTLALPILREFRLPAIFFIPTQAIDTRRLGWWDWIAYAIKNSSENLGKSAQDRLIRECLRRYAQLPAEEAEIYLEEVLDEHEVLPPPISLQSRELMSWQEIRECQLNGIAIGSHTHTHRVLSRLSLEEQREELAQSRKILEARLGTPIRSVAYPVGGYEDFNRETLRIAEECGYSLGFSFRTGSNPPENPFDLRRVAAPAYLAELAALVQIPELLAWRACTLAEPASALS